MENLELNKQEKKELEKRGFVVKENSDLFGFIKNIISLAIIIGPFYTGGLLLSLDINLINLCINITSFLGFLLVIPSFYTYIFTSKLFFSSFGNIAYGKIISFREIKEKKGNITIFYTFAKTLQGIIKWIGIFLDLFSRNKGMGVLIQFSWVLLSIYGFFLLGAYLFGENILIGLIIPIIVIFIGFLLNQGINIFNPIYAFGNLGEKIQKLTPKIEEQSKQIQSEFQSDMNFSVLSNGFDSLSAIFSDIVSLVIKLEEVEARANKGNLFDSEKYINSLRSDIVTPLTSLKVFLEKQKTELVESQKELTRVRVGGSEGTENMELQSKRSESLIQELTENIEKLDVMIGKMGK